MIRPQHREEDAVSDKIQSKKINIKGFYQPLPIWLPVLDAQPVAAEGSCSP